MNLLRTAGLTIALVGSGLWGCSGSGGTGGTAGGSGGDRGVEGGANNQVGSGREAGAPCSAGDECASGRCSDGTCQSSAMPGTSGSGACKKIDVVISVDNSSSMSEEKKAMRDTVFPAFARALQNVGGGLEDFRVGVLDACPRPANFHTSGVSGACGFSTGKPWMDSTSPNLVDEFACVGEVSPNGSLCSGKNDDEQPASTSAAALEPEALQGPNAGFLRDDAVLVVVAITDEDETPTPDASADAVYERLVATKGGNVKRMVFLGIGGKTNCSGAYGSAEEAAKLKAVTAKFEAAGRGVFWDLCEGNLEDGLSQAIAVVDAACGQLEEAGGEGAPCTSDGQCASNACTNGVCEGGDGGKPDGSPCSAGSECASAVCIDGTCRPPQIG